MAANIAFVLGAMLDDWNVRNKTRVVVRDNAANMTKGLDSADVSNIGCFVHTMQLRITKPLDSKEKICNFIHICCRNAKQLWDISRIQC